MRGGGSSQEANFLYCYVGNYGKVKEILHVKTHHNIFALFEGDDECAASGNVLCKHVPGECVCVSK